MRESEITPMEPYRIENLKRRAARKAKTAKIKVELLDDIGELLRVAYRAMQKMGLQDEGRNCRHSHEVRMFAWHFSDKDTTTAEGKMTTGGGTYDEIRGRLRKVYEDAEA